MPLRPAMAHSNEGEECTVIIFPTWGDTCQGFLNTKAEICRELQIFRRGYDSAEKKVLVRKATYRLHRDRVTLKKPVSGRFCPIGRDRELAAVVKHESLSHACGHRYFCVFFYEDDMSPFHFRFLNILCRCAWWLILIVTHAVHVGLCCTRFSQFV
jgi:hypothetical protein